MAGNYLALDVGIGKGTKIALFTDIHTCVAETVLDTRAYGDSYSSFRDAVINSIDLFLKTAGCSESDLRSIGIASAGILRSDGGYLLAQNFTALNGHNLRADLEERYGVPAGMENDANAGALAEWSVLRVELLYWAFGGGWGGAWISKKGEVRFPSHDWDGEDSSLHYTNEPGYSLPLEKSILREIFAAESGSYDAFHRIALEEMGPEGGVAAGPSGDAGTIRAEVALSGPGRVRIFGALLSSAKNGAEELDPGLRARLADPADAGRCLDELSQSGFEPAIRTDRLFGRILAHATQTVVAAASRDGLAEGVPICLGGKPSRALRFFGPTAQTEMVRRGIRSYLRPSVIDERGSNANLVGAAVLAELTNKR